MVSHADSVRKVLPLLCLKDDEAAEAAEDEVAEEEEADDEEAEAEAEPASPPP